MAFSTHSSNQKHLKKTLSTSIIAWALSSLFSTVQAQTPTDVIRADPTPQAPVEKTIYDLPKQKLTYQIIVGTLASNIAAQRGQLGKAYIGYMSLANATRDPRYAELAYKVAEAAGSVEGAINASTLLKTLAPNATLGQDLKVQVEVERAYGLIDAQQYLPAYQAAKTILRSQPDNTAALSLLADVSDRLGRDSEALAALEKLMKLDPDNPENQNGLGYFLADRKIRLDEAEKLINSAHEKRPNAGHITDSLAWINYRLGRLDEALAYAEQANAQEPHEEVMVHYGEILWAKGKQGQALEVFRDVYSGKPFLQSLRDTLERLNIPIDSLKSHKQPATPRKVK